MSVGKRMSGAAASAAPDRTLGELRRLGLHARWVLVLVLEGGSNAAIRERLDRDCLPCPPDGELDALRAAYVPKALKRGSKKAVLAFAKAGLAQFCPWTSVAQEAVGILGHPRVRELVEGGLLLAAPANAIADAVRRHLLNQISPPAINLFRRTFFNLRLAARAELRVEVARRIRLAVMGRVVDPEDEVAARRAIRADARMVALSLGSSPLAFSMMLMAAGHPPIRRELGTMFEELENLAALRTGEALLRGQKGDERRADGFMGVIERLRRVRATVVMPQDALMKSLAQIRIVHDTTPVPTLGALAKPGQAYTTDPGPPLIDAVQRGEHDVVGGAPDDSVGGMELDDGGEDVPLPG